MRRSLNREARSGGAWPRSGIHRAVGLAELDPSRSRGGELSAGSATASFEERYPPLLDHAYCVGLRFFGRDHDLAQEVAQETLTRAYERWSRVLRHPSPEAWIMNAAWKVSLELARKRGRGVPYHVIADSCSFEDQIVNHPHLTGALRRLTKRQRTVVMARYYFGYDVRASAELLGMSESQVKTATNEATTKLRRLLNDETEGAT